MDAINFIKTSIPVIEKNDKVDYRFLNFVRISRAQKACIGSDADLRNAAEYGFSFQGRTIYLEHIAAVGKNPQLIERLKGLGLFGEHRLMGKTSSELEAETGPRIPLEAKIATSLYVIAMTSLAVIWRSLV